MHADPESQFVFTVMIADSSPFKRHAKAICSAPNNPMLPSEVAAKTTDVLSGILLASSQYLIETCFRKAFAIRNIAEASYLPHGGTTPLSKVALE